MADIKIYGKLKNATESGKVANYSDIDGAPEIVQETGQSTEKTMSQKAITDAINAGGGAVYSVIEISTSQTVLTDEQYNTLIASPFNKIKSGNIICDLYQETSTELVYTANYFNNGYRVTVRKNTKAVTSGSLSSLTSISSYVKNSLDYNQSNTTYALSAYQGKVLNDRLIALENSGGGGGSGSASDGFNNLKALNLTPTTYQGAESPSGKFAFRGTGGYTLKDNSSGTITTTIQLPVVPGAGIQFNKTADGNCEISATGGTSTFPAVDLTNATVPGSGEFTKEQADLLYYVNNKTSFIAIQDTINGLATYIVLPLVYLDSVHNYYTYESTVSGNTYTLKAVLQKTTGEVWGVKTYQLSKNTKSDLPSTYMHIIQIGDNGQNNVYFNLTTTSPTQYTYESLIEKLRGKRLYGQGRALVSNKGYPVAYMVFATSTTGSFGVYYYNETGETTQNIMPHTYFNDTVVAL